MNNETKWQRIEDILEMEYPEQVKRWDRWNYKIHSPLSFDDLAKVTIALINKDGTVVHVDLLIIGTATHGAKTQ